VILPITEMETIFGNDFNMTFNREQIVSTLSADNKLFNLNMKNDQQKNKKQLKISIMLIIIYVHIQTLNFAVDSNFCANKLC
jgi:hypothetical protein